jgi:alanine racemase
MGEQLRHSPGNGAALTIDLDALVNNYLALKKQAEPAVCGAAVKADAYGLGIDEVATALAEAGCKVFFTATNDEGIELRQILPDVTIYVLNGLISGTEQTFADFNLRPVLNSLDQIDAWSFFARSRKGQEHPAAIHFDTGMNRLGLSVRDAQSLIQTPERLSAFELSLVMSHLASADQRHNPMNARQLKVFTLLLHELNRTRPPHAPVKASLANSAGILLGKAYHFDLVRPGIGLYGGNPFTGEPNPMQSVIRLQGKILQVREIEAGDSVGYNATYVATSRRRIATVDVGYADGYLRAFSNCGKASINGHEAPVIGRVSMDLLGIDVTAVPENLLQAGAAVDLLGGDVSLDDAAKVSGISAYELLTLLGRRYKRHYVQPQEQIRQVTG